MMAKRNPAPKRQPELVSPQARGIRITKVTDFLNKASLEKMDVTYANHVQIAISTNELFLDLYLVNPHPASSELQAEAIQRIVLPSGIAKGLASAIVNAIAGFEEETKINLPLQREPDPNDRITLWT